MYEQDLRIKKYVNAVERRLRMPRDVRARVMSDFGSSIAARREAGERVEDILESLGSPKKTAAELNEQMKEYTYVKSPWRFLFLAGAVVGLLDLIVKVISMILVYIITGSQSQSMGIIGGADGPTAIFVTSADDGLSIEAKLLLSVILLAGCLFGYYKFSHQKRK